MRLRVGAHAQHATAPPPATTDSYGGGEWFPVEPGGPVREPFPQLYTHFCRMRASRSWMLPSFSFFTGRHPNP